MSFSIIIPVYNVEPYLRECLDSVLQQTYGEWEAVCVDDGSTDGSGDILKEYAGRESRIKIISQPNAGLSAARNTGVNNAQGDYILFLDSDDWLETDTLKKLADNLGGEDMLCFGGWQGEKQEVPTTEGPINGWDYYNSHALEHHEFPFVCVVLRCYRRQFLIENYLDFKEGILHEDNHFTPRVCLKAKSVKVISKQLYHYRIRPGSIMTTRSLRSCEDMIRISNELSELFGKEKDCDKTIVYRFLTQCYQMAFLGNTNKYDHTLRKLVNWRAYRRVSRTKFRHRLNYMLIHCGPSLFRRIARVNNN